MTEGKQGRCSMTCPRAPEQPKPEQTARAQPAYTSRPVWRQKKKNTGNSLTSFFSDTSAGRAESSELHQMQTIPLTVGWLHS